MNTAGLRRLCDVARVDMVVESAEHGLKPLRGGVSGNPVCQCAALRDALSSGAAAQTAPFLLKDEFECCFAAIATAGGTLYVGPMFAALEPGVIAAYCQRYSLPREAAPTIRRFTLPEIRDIVLLANDLAGNPPVSQERLIFTNGAIPDEVERDPSEYARLMLIEEAQDDDSETYRHGYYEEQQLMQAIREGRVEDAIRQAERMDTDAGRFSEQALGHWRNLAVIGITLCSRAAIEGGVLPETAYRISGDYIHRCDSANDAASLLYCRNQAIETLALRVREKLNRNRYSGYVASCKDYVRRHYREKLYLADIASYLDISPNYLSRVFHRETGERLQDYIIRTRVTRAANMLVYTDQSLSEISEYVRFPSQSYFGRVFKAAYGVTPQAYRSMHKTSKDKPNDADISLLT